MKGNGRSDAAPSRGLADALATVTWSSLTDCATFSLCAQTMLAVSETLSTDAFFARVHSEDRTRFEAETITHIEQGGGKTREFRWVMPDGSVKRILHQATVVRAATDEHDKAFGVFVDVTDLREHAPPVPEGEMEVIGFYEFDVETGTSVWSPQLRRLLGGTHTLNTQSQVRECTHPDDRAMVETAMKVAISTPGPFQMSFRVRTQDGQIRRVTDSGEAHGPVNPVTGKVTRITGVLSDVTARYTASKFTLPDHDMFWQLIERAPFGVYAVDSDLRIVRISDGGLPAFNDIDPLIGASLDDVLHKMWPASFATEAVGHFRHTLATGEPYRATPVIETRSDRKIVEAYDWGIDRVHLEDGSFGVICHFYDLTERVRYETELRAREQRLAVAYEAGDMGAWEVDLGTGAVEWAPQLFRMFGASEETANAEGTWKNAIHPDDSATVQSAYSDAMKGGRSLDVDFRIILPDGEVRYLASKGEAITDDDGTPVRMIGVNFDITARKMAEIASRDSERKLRRVIDSAVAFIVVLDADGMLREVNKPSLDISGLERADVLNKPFWDADWWTHSTQSVADVKEAVAKARAGEVVRYDAVVRVAGGRLITIEFMLAPVFEEDGSLQSLVASGFDITERERARAHAQDLMGEINHRSKNILTLVQVVARQTARAGTEGFMSRFEKRLSALANAQDLLLKSTSDRVDLHELAMLQLGHFYDEMKDRINLSGPDIEISPAAAQALGMALHELSTNAGKYGALSQSKGQVDVVWRVLDGAENEWGFRINWTERGGPEVVAPDVKGFGSTVIDDMVRMTLTGDVSLTFDPDGIKWQLDCPLDGLIAL